MGNDLCFDLDADAWARAAEGVTTGSFSRGRGSHNGNFSNLYRLRVRVALPGNAWSADREHALHQLRSNSNAHSCGQTSVGGSGHHAKGPSKTPTSRQGTVVVLYRLPNHNDIEYKDLQMISDRSRLHH